MYVCFCEMKQRKVGGVPDCCDSCGTDSSDHNHDGLDAHHERWLEIREKEVQSGQELDECVEEFSADVPEQHTDCDGCDSDERQLQECEYEDVGLRGAHGYEQPVFPFAGTQNMAPCVIEREYRGE